MNQPNPDPEMDGTAPASSDMDPTQAGGENDPVVPSDPNPSGSPKGDDDGKGSIDYHKKFSASARENQRLREELERERSARQAAEAQAASAAELQLEADLKIEHPDWDVMSETEKILAKSALREKREREKAESRLAGYEKNERFEKSFSVLVKEDEFKKLAGQKDAFRVVFNEHPDTDIRILARSFLFDTIGDTAAQEAAERGSRPGLEDPSGGPSAETPQEGYTEEQLQALAASNPKEFNRIMQGRAQQRQREAISGRPTVVRR